MVTSGIPGWRSPEIASPALPPGPLASPARQARLPSSPVPALHPAAIPWSTTHSLQLLRTHSVPSWNVPHRSAGFLHLWGGPPGWDWRAQCPEPSDGVRRVTVSLCVCFPVCQMGVILGMYRAVLGLTVRSVMAGSVQVLRSWGEGLCLMSLLCSGTGTAARAGGTRGDGRPHGLRLPCEEAVSPCPSLPLRRAGVEPSRNPQCVPP